LNVVSGSRFGEEKKCFFLFVEFVTLYRWIVLAVRTQNENYAVQRALPGVEGI
jgi:hypothetical protein